MEFRRSTEVYRRNGEERTAIMEIEISGYTVFVFQGSLSENDILIKYRKEGQRRRTPKHLHWVVDILMKRQGNEALTREFLFTLQNDWRTCRPLRNNNYSTLRRRISAKVNESTAQYAELNSYGEYPIDFLYTILVLLMIQEKTNRADAYLFGGILDELIKEECDIFKIVAAASLNAR